MKKSKHLNNIGSLMVHMVQKRNIIKWDIIGILLQKEDHIRGIAKKLKEPHSTILRKLNDLVKENVLDFKIEGKNKVFFIKKNLIAKSYIMESELNKKILLMKKHPELAVIFDEILKKTKERMIVLFGSYAKGTEKNDSDIDIYIETTNRNIKKNIESINSKINVKIGSFDIKSPLIKEIIKNHVIIRGLEDFHEQIPD